LLLRTPKFYRYSCLIEKLINIYPNLGTEIEKKLKGGATMDFVVINHTFPEIKNPIPFVCYDPSSRKLIAHHSFVVICNTLDLKISDFEDCAHQTPIIKPPSP